MCQRVNTKTVNSQPKLSNLALFSHANHSNISMAANSSCFVPALETTDLSNSKLAGKVTPDNTYLSFESQSHIIYNLKEPTHLKIFRVVHIYMATFTFTSSVVSYLVSAMIMAPLSQLYAFNYKLTNYISLPQIS